MKDTAPMLGLWSVLADRVMELVKADSRFLARLVRAPRPAVHAYAAWLLANAGMDAATAARHMYETRPEDLLKQALGHDDVAPLWQFLLKRAGDHVLTADRYRRLDRLARSPVAAALWRMQETGEELDVLEAMLILGGKEPLIFAACRAIRLHGGALDTVYSTIRWLRLHGLIEDSPSVRRHLRSRSTHAQLVRALRGYLGRARTHAPDIMVDGSGFRVVPDIHAVARIGREFKNCLARLRDPNIAGLLAGTAILLSWSDGATAPRALVLLDVVARTDTTLMVNVSGIVGYRNRSLEPAEDKRIRDELARLPGIEVVERCLPWIVGYLSDCGDDPTDALETPDIDPFVVALPELT